MLLVAAQLAILICILYCASVQSVQVIWVSEQRLFEFRLTDSQLVGKDGEKVDYYIAAFCSITEVAILATWQYWV